jgi:hypothetical protein
MGKKVVLNTDYGGFSLSRAAFLRLRELGSVPAKQEADYGEMDGYSVRNPGMWEAFCRNMSRTDPLLVQVIEELGDAAAGGMASLEILEVPDDWKKWQILSNDGMESIKKIDHVKPPWRVKP